jgi:hypothetical protein
MSVGVVRGVDLLAASAALLAGVMTWAYVRVIHGQGDQPLAWVLCVLTGGAALAGYGTRVAAPQRRAALGVAGAGLLVLGFLAILSIGLPILIAGALALGSSARPVPTRAEGPRL